MADLGVPFRIQAKNFSITCPQCPLSKEDLLKHFKTLSPVYVIVCEEKHEDGSPHLHAFIQFGRRKNVKDCKYFDFGGYHFNVQATKNVQDWIDYVKKEGQWIEDGILPSPKKKVEHDLQSVPTGELFNYCVNNRVGFGYYQEEKRRRCSVSIDIESPIPGKLCLYLLSLIYDSEKTVVLTGASGSGKTTWATIHAAKPSIIISHIDELKHYRADYHKSIIFDDMSFIQWPVQSQIHIVDRDMPRSIHVRYGVARIPSGVPKIFTCNTFPFSEHEAIRRRIVVHET